MADVEMAEANRVSEDTDLRSLILHFNSFAQHASKQLADANKTFAEETRKIVAEAIAANNPQIVAMATAAVSANATHNANASQQAPSASGEPEHPGSSAPSLNSQDSAEHITPSSQERITPSASTKISLNPPKPFAGKGSDVEQFLRKLQQYLKLSRVPLHEWFEYASTFLEGQPDKLWHSEYAIMQQTMNLVPWDKFESFMLSTFGTIAPLSEAYKEYEQCKQTTTVAEFVSRLRACAQRLKGTFLQQSEGSLTIKFFNGLKPNILKLVEDSAPVGWWTSTEQVFQKAINFELNQAAALGRQHVQSVLPAEDIFASSGLLVKRKANAKESGKKTKKPKQVHAVYIPPEEFKRRQAAKRCTLCGQAGHNYKKCTNERTAQPFA